MAALIPSRSPLWLIWAAAWRAQAVHLGLFVGLPLALTLARTVMAIVFLPISLVGEGDTNVHLSRSMDHLRQPDCWIALAPCSESGRVLFDLPWADNGSRSADEMPYSLVEAYTPRWPDQVTWRHAWFVLWLLWFLMYLRRREAAAKQPKR